MKTRTTIPASMAALILTWSMDATVIAQTALPPPHFHHILLNSTDPNAAIAFYMRQFANTSKAIEIVEAK